MLAADPSPRRSPGTRRTPRAGFCWACALLVLVVALVRLLVTPASPLADVVAAASGPRTVEGRLTGGFAFAPLAVPSRNARASAPGWRVLAAAAKARELIDAAPTAPNLQALGIAALHAANVDAAVQALEDAATADAASAAIHSDLAAAYLARGAQPGHAVDLPRALVAADRALRLNPRLGVAHFNYALALERLHLRQEGARAWENYLARFANGDDPGWTDEARRRRDALMQAPPPEPPSPASEAEARLRDWADAAIARPDDAFLPDLASFGAFYTAIGGAVAQTRGNARQRLALAVRDLLAAEAALAAPNYTAADRLAAGVLERTPDRHSPLHLWAVRLRLTTGFNTGLGMDQQRATADLAATARQLGYAALESDARHRLGAFDFVAGRYERAYEHYAAALRLRESLGNVRAAVSSRSAAADALRMLGRDPEAWEGYLANLRAGGLGEATLENARVTGPANAALNAGLPAVALAFAREAEHVARHIGHPGLLTMARLLQARSLWHTGEAASAAETLQRAHEAFAALDDEAIRGRYLAEFALVESEVLSTTNPVAALPALAEAERRFSTNVGQRQLARAVLEARVHRRLGNLEGARAALRKGVALVEAQQEQIAQADFLPSFLDASWDVFAEFVDLEATANDGPAALQWLDRGFDIRRRWSGGPASLAEASRGGPLVVYLTRPQALWIWVVRDGAVHQRRVAVAREALVRKAARLAHVLTLDTPPAVLDEAAAAIAGDVWWPVASVLSQGGEAPARVALVPDPVLQGVPFALLPWAADAAARVVDVTATVRCPSVFACRAVDAGAVPPGARVAALHAGQGGDGFAALPATRDEAEQIGRRYAGASVETATESSFARALVTSDIVHFSGHAVPDERYPGRSALLLADDAGQAVRVPIARMLRGPIAADLVVLSACRTSRAEARRGEGGVGVAGEFLRAGVRHVVAAQWDVQDDAARELMDLVHDALASGAAPWDAVRQAQRDIRRGTSRPVRDWAGYVAYTSVPIP